MPVWLSAVSIVLAASGALGAAYAVARERGLTAMMDAYRVGNQELRSLWDTERTAREEQSARHALAFADQEAKCAAQLAAQAEKVAHLGGQVETLQSGIVGTLVAELRAALVDAVHSAMNDPERRTS